MLQERVLGPLLDHDDHPTVMAVLFGDPACQELGYPLLGLPVRAGLRLAAAGLQP